MTTLVQKARVKPEAVVLPMNLLTNGGFEIWERGAGPFTDNAYVFTADEWYKNTDPGQVTREASTLHDGAYSLKMDFVSANGSYAYVRQGIDAWKNLEGKWLTFSVWVKFFGAADAVHISIQDWNGSSQTYTLSDKHSGGGDWERLTVTHQINTGLVDATSENWPHGSPIVATVWINDFVGSTDYTAYVDSAMCVEGYFPEGAPFIPTPSDEDLDRCQRYFEKSSTPSWAGAFLDHVKNSIYDGNHTQHFRFKAKKDAAPTVTITNFVSANTIRGVHGFTTTPNDAGFAYYLTDDDGATQSQLWSRFRLTYEAEVS